MSDFRSEARRWLAAEPDADMREELEALLAGDDDELAFASAGACNSVRPVCAPRWAAARSG